MSKSKSRGKKFVSRYPVAASQIYKGDPGPDVLKIPGPDHWLFDPSSPTTFDEVKVRQIDTDGQCSQIIEVLSDTDTDTLWVVDGRETLQNVREVNRRRAKEKRKPVELRLATFKPLAGSESQERDVIAHLVVRNFHRRLPTPSSYALNILLLHRRGHTWEQICQLLHVESDDPKQWCGKRLPIAHCVPEVRAAFDSGELPLAKVWAFGGRAHDGSEALGKTDQLALLRQLREQHAAPSKRRPIAPSVRKKVAAALSNGETSNLCTRDAEAAKVFAAALVYAETGDLKALAEWPGRRQDRQGRGDQAGAEVAQVMSNEDAGRRSRHPRDARIFRQHV